MLDNFTMPDDTRRGGVCGVLAIAASTGNSFERVYSLCAFHCKHRKRFSGGTTHAQRLAVLEALNVHYEVIQVERMPLSKFAIYHARPNTTYMVTTTRHVQLVRVIDGQAYTIDQTGKKHISEYWGKNKFINRDILIMPEIQAAPTKERPVFEVLPSALVEVQPALFPSLMTAQVMADNRQQLNLF